MDSKIDSPKCSLAQHFTNSVKFTVGLDWLLELVETDFDLFDQFVLLLGPWSHVVHCEACHI